MTAPSKVILPLVFGGLLWGLGGVPGGAVAEEPAERAAGEAMPPGGWKKQLLRWRDWLHENDPRRGDEDLDSEKQEVRDHIRNIRDPKALQPLQAMLADEQDYLRLFYLEAVAGIGGADAQRLLVRVSVGAGDQEVRRAAARWIGKMENAPKAIPQYVKYLAAHRYSPAAAEALSNSGLTRQVSMIEDLDPPLTNGLINALVLKGHKVVPVDYYRYWTPGVDSVGPDGSVRSHGWGWFSDRAYLPVHFPVPNPQALKALTEYTGHDYGYNQEDWKRWYQKRKRTIGNQH